MLVWKNFKLKFRALIIGTAAYELAYAPVPILYRAGFEIDSIFLGEIHYGPYRVNLLPIKNNSVAETAAEFIGKFNYDLIVTADEESIVSILESNLPEEVKLKLLPVISIDNFKHLASKCGLSNILKENNVLTPPFFICNTPEEVHDAVQVLGFPIFIKIDKSSGGGGVFECTSIEEVVQVSHVLPSPLLVQKKMNGTTVDLTAFYQNGILIHFTYSTFLKTIGGKHGPSSVREYTQNGVLSGNVFFQLQNLGIALGANGFVNVTCIECALTQNRYIFEADMRPNVWVDYGKFIGNDVAQAFFNFFSYRNSLIPPIPISDKHPLRMVLSYPGRLSVGDLIINKYNCWKIFNSINELLDFIFRRITSSVLTLWLKFPQLIFIERCKLDGYKRIPYAADLRLRLFCNKYLKPFLPSYVWKFFIAVYRGIKE